MTNFEYIKQAINNENSQEKLSSFLCDHFAIVITKHLEETKNTEIDICELCPFTDRCGRGHNGILDYFQAERGE